MRPTLLASVLCVVAAQEDMLNDNSAFSRFALSADSDPNIVFFRSVRGQSSLVDTFKQRSLVINTKTGQFEMTKSDALVESAAELFQLGSSAKKSGELLTIDRLCALRVLMRVHGF
jgi:hypothetical protein